jgi:hypothetical protein
LPLDQVPPHVQPIEANARTTTSADLITPGGTCAAVLRSISANRHPAGGATEDLLRSGFCTGLMSMAAPYAWADQEPLPATWRQL